MSEREVQQQTDAHAAASILLVEDTITDARLVETMLAHARWLSVSFYHAETFSAAERRLAEGAVDLVLLDINLPDSVGMATIDRMRTLQPETPLIILTSSDDEMFGMKAIGVGVQDYLVKGTFNADGLSRAVRYALERDRVHKQAERQMQHLADTWQYTFDAMPLMISIHDKEFRILQANKAYAAAVGRPLSEIIGTFCFQLIHGTEQCRRECPHRQALQTAQLVSREFFEPVLNRYVLMTAFPQFDVNGQVVSTVHIMEDISERKQAERELSASRDFLRSIVENLPLRVFWKDINLRYLGCNTAFAHDAGMSGPEEMIGKDDFQMGWKEHAELYRADDKTVLESGIPKIGYEEPLRTPDGNIMWLRTSKVPLRDAENKVLCLLGAYEDITEQKQMKQALQESEDRFMDVMYASSDAILLIGDNIFIDCNEATFRMLGYHSREEVIHKHPAWLAPPTQPDGRDSLEKAEEMTRLALETGFCKFEWICRRAGGEDFPVEVSLTPIVRYGKKLLYCVWHEISARKKMEAESRKHLHELEVFYKASLGREQRILELKQKVIELETQLRRGGVQSGLPPQVPGQPDNGKAA